MKKYLIIALSLIAFSLGASTPPRPTVIEQKEIKAIQLINMVARFNNERFSSDLEKGESEEAYYGFLARFENLKEDREVIMSPKEIENYSNRYDLLIKDLQKFLK